MKSVAFNLSVVCGMALVALCLYACAGERQGLVCSEIQYRLDTQTYSPDQRAYIEEELRVCREEEAKKRGADAQTRQGIYERYAASGQADSASADSARNNISVSEALKDSSGQETLSIYDRYKAVDSTAGASTAVREDAAQVAPDTSAADAGSFQ
ncbi:hypothetical protein SAMN05720781_1611 [Fibrobacter sp. UWT3]|uniref:hypothetical protein n=1 Tax=Fibrobacter sp. UWT3 TaxID=1896225 RepID=UPI000BCA3AB9|nr:hypothetical protein [Fibrobacter sp. UWT3]SOE75450.1 hypothetical protein SAMN05720781_1611 [Fibrobacter sp. UWT3]